ncbi:MAG: hypothetical protein AAGF23_18825, partial [Acidobacteriota bacterium]
GQVRGWASRGLGDGPATHLLEEASSAPWSQMVAANSAVVLDSEASAAVASKLGGPSMDGSVLVPFAIRGQISGALWAGRAPGEAINVSALQLLVHVAAMALETASVSPGRSPALSLEGALPQASETPPQSDRQPVDSPAEPESLEEVPGAAEEGVAAEDATAEEDAEQSLESEAEEPTQDDVAAVDVEPAVVEERESPQPAAFVDAPPTRDEATSSELEASSEPEAAAVEPVQDDGGDTQDGARESAVTEQPARLADAPSSQEEPEEPSDDAESTPENYVPTEDDIALEAEPEPELEDTNIWELEEDDEDDEPTQVGMAASIDGAEEIREPEPVEPPVVGQETVRIDLATIQQDQAALAEKTSDPGDETSPTVHAVARPAEPDSSLDESPAVATPAPSFVEPEVAPQEPAAPASFVTTPSSFAEPVPASPPSTSFASPPPEEPAAPEKPATAGGSTEVVPPPDLDGPGLAFATPEPAAAAPRVDEGGDAALHEEARRLARLLVSEIKLYNEEIIEEGRRSGNIYERLKDDIDRSRQMYEERIDPRLADQEDYFYQELVQRLAGGDERLLGM